MVFEHLFLQIIRETTLNVSQKLPEMATSRLQMNLARLRTFLFGLLMVKLLIHSTGESIKAVFTWKSDLVLQNKNESPLG